jgi:hypothetical protein
VVSITYSLLPVPEDLLPARQKEIKCESNAVICIQGREAGTAVFEGLPVLRNDRWTRIGHGHGFDSVARLEGYALRSFLEANFPGATGSDFFLFVSCDGYRCLFSGREIFYTTDGREMMIARALSGQKPKEGLMLVPAADFFHDRAMWGLSHLVMLHL